MLKCVVLVFHQCLFSAFIHALFIVDTLVILGLARVIEEIGATVDEGGTP